MCSVLWLMLAEGRNKEKRGEAEKRKQNQRLAVASISTAWLCLLKERVFVMNRADRSIYTSSFCSNIGSLLVNDCCDITVPKLLISQNTINLRNEECFLFLMQRLKGVGGRWGGGITKLKVMLEVKRVICSFEGKWIGKQSLYSSTATEQFCLW